MRTHIGTRLRAARERAGLTRAAVAEATGLCISTIEKIESGRAPSPKLATALALAAAVGVPLNELAAAR